MSAQQDSIPEGSSGKGTFPRAYSPGRQQRYYDGYAGINWGKKPVLTNGAIPEQPKCCCTSGRYSENCEVYHHSAVARSVSERAQRENLNTNTTNPGA